MNTTFTKFFPFSASRSSGARVPGHNYVLGVTTSVPKESQETELVRRIEESLIRKIHTRDLADVDFLRPVPEGDEGLLRAFWPVVEASVVPAKLLVLTLERDRRTTTTLSA